MHYLLHVVIVDISVLLMDKCQLRGSWPVVTPQDVRVVRTCTAMSPVEGGAVETDVHTAWEAAFFTHARPEVVDGRSGSLLATPFPSRVVVRGCPVSSVHVISVLYTLPGPGCFESSWSQCSDAWASS